MVQYKELTDGRRKTEWQTVDEDIPAGVRTFEVTGLKTGECLPPLSSLSWSHQSPFFRGHQSKKTVYSWPSLSWSYRTHN